MMMLASCVMFVSVPGAPAADEPSPEIRTVLERQTEAWNRGDLEGFMATYWKSEALTFSAGGKTTRGWQATLDRYKARYSTVRQMGRLRFTELETTRLGDGAALALGRWHLTLEDGDREGNFTIVLRRVGGQWVIIHDHSSEQDE